MTFDEIGAILGEETVAAVQAAVRAAFVKANAEARGNTAVEELLVSMLAAVIAAPPGDKEAARAMRAHFCCERLKEILERAESVPSNVVDLRRRPRC